MGVKLHIIALSLLILLATTTTGQADAVFDVQKYGAKADAQSDISQALLTAWKEACASTSPSKVLVPGGTYMLSSVLLEGPCKAPIELQVQGTLKAPADPNQFKEPNWVSFNHIDGFTLSGPGTFDGQGARAWSQNDCGTNTNCKTLPINIRFNFISNGVVRDITSLDSKQFHVNVLGCNNLAFQNVHVTAPEGSLNTDGIHIGRSTGINITDTVIGTGDDCISLGDGSKQINVERVICGPGHGISVGSLGKYVNEEAVVGLKVKNCTLIKTQNGVRIKTWPASYVGTVSDMHFEDINMVDVGNPIIIDQVYCPYNQCNAKIPSRVKISNVKFINIRGTSATQLAVKLACSGGLPCEGVELSEIDLKYNGSEGPATSECTNVKPTITGKLNPAGCGN